MKRLDACLSSCGVGTRSEVKALIKKGKVSVNGSVIRDFSFKIEDDDTVCVNGTEVDTSEYVYLMLNKPCGYVSTTDENEKNVIDLVPSEYYRKNLFPVGRLDKDTSGLIFITNDGDFSHRITAPSRQTEKEYAAVLERDVDEETVKAFADGMTLKDGYKTMPAKILLTDNPKEVHVIIEEGKYHQVRRMFACCNNRVTGLKRIRIGEVLLDFELPEGQVRPLTEREVKGF